jgi:hypothetical protein
MPEYRIGQTATDHKTGEKIRWDGQNWVSVPGTGRGGAGGPKPGQTASGALSPQAQNFLNDLSKNAASAREIGKLYDSTEQSLTRLQPGPWRNRLLLQPGIPEEGGVMDAVSGAVIGGPLRLTGAISPQNVDDYQNVRRVQNAAVLERQIPQKGAQTESDAARMMLADVSPGKTLEANKQVIAQARKKIEREQAKSIFYAKFTNLYGLYGLSPHGHTADELWAKQGDAITNQLFHGIPIPGGHGQPRKGTIRVISRTPAGGQ